MKIVVRTWRDGVVDVTHDGNHDGTLDVVVVDNESGEISYPEFYPSPKTVMEVYCKVISESLTKNNQSIKGGK